MEIKKRDKEWTELRMSLQVTWLSLDSRPNVTIHDHVHVLLRWESFKVTGGQKGLITHKVRITGKVSDGTWSVAAAAWECTSKTTEPESGPLRTSESAPLQEIETRSPGRVGSLETWHVYASCSPIQ